MKRQPLLALLSLGIVICLAWWSESQEAGAPPFELVADWPKLPPGVKIGDATAVATDAEDRVYVFHRGKRPILVLDRDGTPIRSWGDNQVKVAHGLRIDPQGYIWTTDIGTHTVVKYDAHGTVLLTLGTKGKRGNDATHFNMPADVAFGPRGEIYVADGYGNSRVAKFAADGKFLKDWGKKGKAPGQFNLVHAIRVDAQGYVFVGDRENNRVQVFDGDGKFVEQWPVPGGPYGLELQPDHRFFIAAGRAEQVRWADAHGKILAAWGRKGQAPGDFQMPHGIAADSRGNVYVAEGEGQRVQKFRRRAPG